MQATARAIYEQRLSVLELVEQCLATIDRWENRLHAWVQVDPPAARQSAEALDQELAAGHWRGPLHGLPIGVKDIIDCTGLPTRAGAPWLGDHLSQSDAPLVARFRRAGAIVLGKTVTTQLACFDPAPTVNPWNVDRTPGGSSSGSAVAVSAGMCPLSIGTQTGGSVTRPASYCGIASYKPGLRQWSTEGIVPVSFHLDQPGMMARRVDDLWLAWHAVQGNDGWPPTSAGSSAPPLLFGRPDGLFADRLEPSARAVIDGAIDRLSAAGAEIRPVELPKPFDGLLDHHRRLMSVELATAHSRLVPDDFPGLAPGVWRLIEEGRSTRLADYVRSLKHRISVIDQLPRRFAETAPIWITPATTSAAPDRSTTGDSAMNAVWSYVGVPTLSVPCGLDTSGLPLALQLVTRIGNEGMLFRAGLWCDTILSFRDRPEMLSAGP